MSFFHNSDFTAKYEDIDTETPFFYSVIIVTFYKKSKKLYLITKVLAFYYPSV